MGKRQVLGETGVSPQMKYLNMSSLRTGNPSQSQLSEKQEYIERLEIRLS